MSAISVETILSRAMSDASFADQLFANPEQALAGFELSADELSNLKGLSRAQFDTLAAASPEERKSFAGMWLADANHNQSALKVRR